MHDDMNFKESIKWQLGRRHFIPNQYFNLIVFFIATLDENFFWNEKVIITGLVVLEVVGLILILSCGKQCMSTQSQVNLLKKNNSSFAIKKIQILGNIFEVTAKKHY